MYSAIIIYLADNFRVNASIFDFMHGVASWTLTSIVDFLHGKVLILNDIKSFIFQNLNSLFKEAVLFVAVLFVLNMKQVFF